jgi:hypothetical protein
MELQIKAHSEIGISFLYNLNCFLSEDGVIESIHGTVYSLLVAERPRAMNSVFET